MHQEQSESRIEKRASQQKLNSANIRDTKKLVKIFEDKNSNLVNAICSINNEIFAYSGSDSTVLTLIKYLNAPLPSDKIFFQAASIG